MTGASHEDFFRNILFARLSDAKAWSGFPAKVLKNPLPSPPRCAQEDKRGLLINGSLHASEEEEGGMRKFATATTTRAACNNNTFPLTPKDKSFFSF